MDYLKTGENSSVSWQSNNRRRLSIVRENLVSRIASASQGGSMRFRVGPHNYQLAVAPGPVVSDNRRMIAVTLPGDRKLLVSADCEPNQRLHAVLHELTRAWTLETAKPRTDEEWFQLLATVAMSAINDLTSQGGEAAVSSMMPGDNPAARITLSRNRVCGTCGGTIASGSVACAPTAIPGILELRAWCEFCDATMVWRESATAKGLPGGVVVGTPRFEAGDTSGVNVPSARVA